MIRSVISQNLVKIKWFNFSSFFQWLCHFIPANGAHMPVPHCQCLMIQFLARTQALPLSPTLFLRGLITISLHHRQAFICQCAEGTESSVADPLWKGFWRQGFLMSSEKLLCGSAKAPFLPPPIPTSRRVGPKWCESVLVAFSWSQSLW